MSVHPGVRDQARPSGSPGDSPTWPRRIQRHLAETSPYLWDCLLAAFLLLADISEMRFFHSLFWPLREIASLPVVMVIVVARSLLVALRRRYPLAVSLLISATMITVPTHGVSYLFSPATTPAFVGDPGWWPTAFGYTATLEAMIGVYTVTALRGRRRGAVAGIWYLLCLSPWLIPQALSYGPAAVIFNPLIVGIAFYLGDVRRRILSVFGEIEERSERIERGRKRAARDAAFGERERASADLQSLVARNLRRMVGQARTAREAVESQGGAPPAREAIGAIEQTGRAALADARRALGLLRDEHGRAPLRPALGPAAAAGARPTLGRPTRAPVRKISKGSSSRQPTLADSSLALILMVFFVTEIGVGEGLPPHKALHLISHPADVAGIVLITLPLAWRRAYPIATAFLVSGGFAAHATAGHFFSLAELMALLIVVYSVWSERGVRQGLAAVAAAAAVLPTSGSHFAEIFQFGLVTVYLPFLPGAAFLGWQERGLGLALRRRQEQEMELRQLAEAELEHARTEERLRIARDLHDVTAHSLSVMTIQAGAARTIARSSPQRALQALANVEDIGRRAQAELGEVFSAERNLPGTDLPPAIASIPTLAQRMADAGLAVDLDLSPLPELSPGLDMSLYRVVQEALTNAAKHAGPTRVRVRLRRDDGIVLLEIEDDGPDEATLTQDADRDAGGGGRGLIGMRERVRAFGGALAAGRRMPSGFTVTVTVPLTADPSS